MSKKKNKGSKAKAVMKALELGLTMGGRNAAPPPPPPAPVAPVAPPPPVVAPLPPPPKTYHQRYLELRATDPYAAAQLLLAAPKFAGVHAPCPEPTPEVAK